MATHCIADGTHSDHEQIIAALDYLRDEQPAVYERIAAEYRNVPTWDIDDDESTRAMLATDPNLADDLAMAIEENSRLYWRDGELFAMGADYLLCDGCTVIAEYGDTSALDMLPTDRAAELRERIAEFFERVGHVVMLGEARDGFACDACGERADTGNEYAAG